MKMKNRDEKNRKHKQFKIFPGPGSAIRWAAKTPHDEELRARFLCADRPYRCFAGPLDQAHGGAAHPTVFAYSSHSWLFSSNSYREHGRGFQPVRGLECALENGHADRVFRDRADRGLDLALEKRPCSRGYRRRLVTDYGRSFGESLGSPGPRARGRLSVVLCEAVSVAGI